MPFSLENLLGQSEEMFEPWPCTTDARDGEFLVLEVGGYCITTHSLSERSFLVHTLLSYLLIRVCLERDQCPRDVQLKLMEDLLCHICHICLRALWISCEGEVDRARIWASRCTIDKG